MWGLNKKLGFVMATALVAGLAAETMTRADEISPLTGGAGRRAAGSSAAPAGASAAPAGASAAPAGASVAPPAGASAASTAASADPTLSQPPAAPTDGASAAPVSSSPSSNAAVAGASVAPAVSVGANASAAGTGTAAAAVDCSTYRLDWEQGGPFNPDRSGTSGVCEGEADRAACLAAHRGDGQTHPYVIVHDQGVNGNCTFQALSGLLNFHKSATGAKPDTSPEYLMAQDCDEYLPGHRHRTIDAFASYRRTQCTCGREDLARVSNGGDLTQSLSALYHEAQSRAFVRGAFGDPGLTDRQVQGRQDFCTNLTNHDNGSVSQLYSDIIGATETLSRDNNIGTSWERDIETQLRISRAAVVAGNTADAGRLNADEWERCTASRHVLNNFCQAPTAHAQSCTAPQTPTVPLRQQPHLIPDPPTNFSQASLDLAAQRCNISTGRRGHASYNTVDRAYTNGNPDARTCIADALNEDYNRSVQPARQHLLQETFSHVSSAHEPVIIDVADMSRLVGKSQSRSDQGHALLMIGRQQRGGQCGYWVRNSWGSECPSTSGAVYCDPNRPGSVWIPQSALTSGVGIRANYDVHF